jgi:hypothetical protein
LLVILFTLSLSYDLGAFSESTWNPRAIAAESGETGDASHEEEHGHTNPVTTISQR